MKAGILRTNTRHLSFVEFKLVELKFAEIELVDIGLVQFRLVQFKFSEAAGRSTVQVTM